MTRRTPLLTVAATTRGALMITAADRTSKATQLGLASKRPRSNSRRMIAIVMLGSTALIFGACGGGTSNGAAKPLPKKEFITSADKLCASASKRFDATVSTAPANFNPAKPEGVPLKVIKTAGPPILKIADIEDNLAGNLRSLAPPVEFLAQWKHAVTALERRVGDFREAGLAAKRGDRTALAVAFQRASREGTVGRGYLRGYGFKACGVG